MNVKDMEMIVNLLFVGAILIMFIWCYKMQIGLNKSRIRFKNLCDRFKTLHRMVTDPSKYSAGEKVTIVLAGELINCTIDMIILNEVFEEYKYDLKLKNNKSKHPCYTTLSESELTERIELAKKIKQ